MKVLFALTVLTLCGGRAATAQNREAQRTAAATAQSFFNALAEGHWEDAARLMDLQEFDKYRQSAITNARRPQREFVMTPERLMRQDPKMPRAVAEYQAQEFNERSKTVRFDYLSDQFAGISNLDSLAALPVQLAAARWLQAMDPQWQMLHSRYGDSTCKPIIVKHPMHARMKVLAAAVADSIAYVVYDHDFAFVDGSAASPRPISPDFLSVLVLGRRRNRWVVQTTEGLRGNVGTSVVCSAMDSDTSSVPRPR